MITHKFHVIGISVFLLGILGSCALQPSTPSVQNVHIQPQASAPLETQAEEIGSSWVTHLSAAVNTTPLVSGSLVIVPTADGVIHAIQAETGETVWVYSDDIKIWDASVNVDENKICAGVEGRQVICLDSKTGSLLWTTQLALEVQSRLALTPDRVFAPTTHAGSGLESDFNGRASLIALDAASGEVLWEAVTQNYILRRPVVSGEIVVIGGAYQVEGQAAGSVATRVYALNTVDGSVLWKYESDDGLLRWVDTDGETVVFSAASETVYALSLTDGRLLWNFGPGYWMQFPAMQDDKIFFGSGDHLFQSLNASTGQVNWQQSINLSSLNQVGRPVLREERIWFNSVTGEIYALDAATGEVVQYLATGHSSRVGGALYQNMYILGDPDGNLYAYAIQ